MSERTRPLSFRQASNCETAREPKCVCRCGGALHGARRGMGDQLEIRGFYEQLHDDDPHHIPSEKERKELAHTRAMVTSLRKWRVRYGKNWTRDDERGLAVAEKRLEQLEVIVLGIHPPTATATRRGNGSRERR